MSQPLFSRGSRPSLFGKRTRKAQTLLSDDTKDALQKKWRELGYSTESEFLADVIEVAVHGADHVRMLQERRLKELAG